MPRLTGLVAAPHTPMNSDGSLRLEVIDRHAECLRAAGVRGAFVCGTTGEGLSLTVAERQAVAERWVRAAAGRLAVIVHAGSACLADACALAAHAREVGADAVAAVPPFYFRPRTVADLADGCAEIASAAGELPFYYYHIPSLTGVAFAMRDFLEAASGRVPNLAGVKFTHEDLADFIRCLAFEGGRFDMLFGRDEQLLSALACGATGAVGGTYGYAAPLYARLMDAWRAGDLETARRLQTQATEMVAVLERFGGLPASKAAMGLAGLDCGPVRPPLRELSADELACLRAELDRVGFFEFCMRT